MISNHAPSATRSSLHVSNRTLGGFCSTSATRVAEPNSSTLTRSPLNRTLADPVHPSFCRLFSFFGSPHRTLFSLPLLPSNALAGAGIARRSQSARELEDPFGFSIRIEERVGVEPTVPCGTPDFESGTFGHSVISPKARCAADPS